MSSSRHTVLILVVAASLGVFLLALPAAGQVGGREEKATSRPAAVESWQGYPGFHNENPGTVIETRQLESVLGVEVRTRSAENMGRVVDLLANRYGRVEAAVIEFGGFLGIGTRKIAVEWSALTFQTEGRQPVAVLEMTRDQLRAAPEYKPGEQAVVVRTDQ